MEKVVLATGIYPPDVGGPAFYAEQLAEELVKNGIEVTVVTYGKKTENRGQRAEGRGQKTEDNFPVIFAARGLPVLRWWRYASALREHASNADIVYVLSSVSCGVPLWLARLKKPKKILRIGGDFFWERAVCRGSKKSIKEWYASSPLSRIFMGRLFRTFDSLVFSSPMLLDLYVKYYPRLPKFSLIENAVPSVGRPVTLRSKRHPFRLLALGRIVRVKNLGSLIRAMRHLPAEMLLTIVGEGPEKHRLQRLVHACSLEGRVAFSTPIYGQEKQELFAFHDLLVLPSLSEVSPNVALEAAAAGLPALVTKEVGLSAAMTKAMVLADMRTPEKIAAAVQQAYDSYPPVPVGLPERSWSTVCEEHLALFRTTV